MSEFLPGRSYVVVGELPTIAVETIDRLAIDGAECDVKELRATLSRVYERPYGERRLLIIHNAEGLSDIHQNTLLKALEEPPAFLIILLHTQFPESLLPTVRSRLHVWQGASSREQVAHALPEEVGLLEKSLQAIKEREKLVATFRQELSAQMAELDQPESEQRITVLEKVINRLTRNANQKLVIDWFLLHWSASSGNG